MKLLTATSPPPPVEKLVTNERLGKDRNKKYASTTTATAHEAIRIIHSKSK